MFGKKPLGLGTPGTKMPSQISEVQKTSKKESLPVFPEYTKPISDRILSHLQADFFIREVEGLEGIRFTDSLHYMIHSLKHLPEELQHEQLKELISQFEQCWELENMLIPSETEEGEEPKVPVDVEIILEKIHSGIKALKPKERFLIPGGWVGSNGHAMKYVVEKQENGKYSLFTFNTGAGLASFHDSEIDSHGYRRYKPLEYRINIEEKELLKPHRLRSLMELMRNLVAPFDKHYATAMIYDSILPSFGGEVGIPPTKMISAMRGQRSGTCAWKVLLALLREKVDLETYKTIKIEFRIQNIKDYLSQRETLTSSQYYHLINDIENLNRALRKTNHKYEIDDVKKKFTELQEIKKTVEGKYNRKDEAKKTINTTSFPKDATEKVK